MPRRAAVLFYVYFDWYIGYAVIVVAGIGFPCVGRPARGIAVAPVRRCWLYSG